MPISYEKILTCTQVHDKLLIALYDDFFDKKLKSKEESDDSL
jgi:hypothetical protein